MRTPEQGTPDFRKLPNSQQFRTEGRLDSQDHVCPALRTNKDLNSLTWRFMRSYKWGYRAPNMSYKYSYPTYNPNYNYPSTSK